MAVENDFLPFAVGGAANVLSQAAYVALTSLLADGFQTGTAQSPQVNKVWRQGSIMAAVIGQLIADATGQNAIDDGTISTLEANLARVMRGDVYKGTDNGAVNAYAMTLSPAPLAITPGMLVAIEGLVATNTGTATLNLNALGALPIQFPGGIALKGNELQAGNGAILRANSTATAWILLHSTGIRVDSFDVVGTSRNLRASLTAAGTSLTFTADEVAVKSALGGFSTLVSSLNATINIATVGANGMDTGAAPASGYVAIYAIYNPATKATALLGVNATAAAAPNIYGGANMPAGYTLSGLISVWPTNGSSQLVVGGQIDRRLSFPSITVYSSTSPPTSPTSLSIASAVPKNARSVRGNLFIGAATTTSSYGFSVASDGAGSGVQTNAGYSPAGGSSSSSYSLSISTPQTIYQWNSGSPTTGTTWGVSVSAYEI